MKSTEIKVLYDTDRLFALKQYMEKKDVSASLEKELIDAIEKLYEKYVPAQVREFIDIKNNTEEKTDKKESKPKASGKNKDAGSGLDTPQNSFVPDNNKPQYNMNHQINNQ